MRPEVSRTTTYEVHYSAGVAGPAVYDNYQDAWERYEKERAVPSYVDGRPRGDLVHLLRVYQRVERLAP